MKTTCKKSKEKYVAGSTTIFIHDTTRAFDPFGLGVFDIGSAVFTAEFDSNSTVLNVTSVTSGTITIASLVTDSNYLLAPNTTIISFGTGTGGVGTYNVNIAQGPIASEQMNTTGSGALIQEDTRGTMTLVTEVWYPVDKHCVNASSQKAYFYDFYFASGPNDTNAYNCFLQAENIDGYNPNNAKHDPTYFLYQKYYQGSVLSDSDPRYVAATQLAFATARNSYKDAPIPRTDPFQ